MPNWSTADITRFETNAEQIFAAERPCIIDRISLAITSGTAIYSIPNYVTSIRRITYRGWQLYPMPHRDLRQSFMSGTQQGRPYWYIFNNIGQGQLRFFPVPQENIAQDTVYTNLWGPNILNTVIMEFFRLPDNQDTQGRYNIPLFIRRRLLKNYVMMRSFQMEGRGIKLRNAKYWSQKWDFMKSTYSDLLDDLNNKPRNIVASNNSSRPYGFTPPPPILPIDRFGYSVDDITG